MHLALLVLHRTPQRLPDTPSSCSQMTKLIPPGICNSQPSRRCSLQPLCSLCAVCVCVRDRQCNPAPCVVSMQRRCVDVTSLTPAQESRAASLCQRQSCQADATSHSNIIVTVPTVSLSHVGQSWLACGSLRAKMARGLLRGGQFWEGGESGTWAGLGDGHTTRWGGCAARFRP